MVQSGSSGDRWEFRAWGDLRGPREALAAIGELQGSRDVVDRYLLGNEPTCSAKFRGDVLEVKRFVDHRDGFELWTPAWEAREPLEVDVVRRLFVELGVDHMVAGLDDVVLPMSAGAVETHLENLPGVGWSEVTKERTDYTVGASMAEATHVRLGARGDWTWSVAIEGTDLAALRSLRTRLGLDGAENVAVHRAAVRASPAE